MTRAGAQSTPEHKLLGQWHTLLTARIWRHWGQHGEDF